jgi:peptidyl-prolyl cis-trans isomerase B (cyclophilin B)
MEITAKVKMKTNKGDMIIGLYGNEAPITVKNFLDYVESGFYTNVIFHRVIPNFVIQGGGFEPKMVEKSNKKAPIKLEIAPIIKHEKYVLSMARTQVRDSATSQFFICLGRVTHLDNQYAGFGKVIEGEEVVDEIAKVKTKSAGFHQDVPAEDMIILSAEVI